MVFDGKLLKKVIDLGELRFNGIEWDGERTIITEGGKHISVNALNAPTKLVRIYGIDFIVPKKNLPKLIKLMESEME